MSIRPYMTPEQRAAAEAKAQEKMRRDIARGRECITTEGAIEFREHHRRIKAIMPQPKPAATPEGFNRWATQQMKTLAPNQNPSNETGKS
jgi:hypothetical protein